MTLTTNANGTAGIGGNASFGGDTSATYSLGTATFTGGPNNGFDLFPVSGLAAGTESFRYSASDGDSLTGTVTRNELEDHTPQPKFFGIPHHRRLDRPNAAFTSNFASLTAHIDWITNSIGSLFDDL
jgi:hypothetical protein